MNGTQLIEDTARGKREPRKLLRAGGDAQMREREVSEVAGVEVAEATDLFVAGALPVEATAQVESVALGMSEAGAAAPERVGMPEADLTADEQQEVGKSVFRLAWPAIAE